jgi:hypothetical protein
MANQPKDLLAQEIDDELRREQLLKLWDKYGIHVLIAALAVIVGVAGWKYYQYAQEQAARLASVQYIVALGDLSSNRTFDGQKRLQELIPKAPPGYAALARLRLAGAESAQGSAIDALKAYEQIAKDPTVDPIFQDYARLQIVMLKFDAVPYPELRNQLSSLASDRSPWRHSARELMGLGAMKEGWPLEARNHFQRLLGDRDTPPGIAERARVMVAMLDEADQAQRAVKDAAKAAAPKSATPGAEEKPETPSKAVPAGDKAKVVPGKTK